MLRISNPSLLAGLNYVRTGPRSGHPVVLIHALGLDLTYWDHQIEALSDRYDTIALDLPGHGRSEGQANAWSLDAITDTLAEAIRGAGGRGVHLVGLSVGSMIAQSVAVQYPQLVCSLTLIGSATTFPEESRSYLRGLADMTRASGMTSIVNSSLPHWFAQTTKDRRPDIIDRVTKSLLHDSPEIHAAVWDFVADFDLEEAVKSIDIPTLLLVGDQDVNTPPANTQLIASLIAGSEMHVVDGGAHMLPFEVPHQVNQHLLRFLQQSAEL